MLTSWIFEAEIAQPLFSGGSPPGCRVSERQRLLDGGHHSVFVDLFLAQHIEKRRPIEIRGLTHEPCVEWAGGRHPGLREAAQQPSAMMPPLPKYASRSTISSTLYWMWVNVLDSPVGMACARGMLGRRNHRTNRVLEVLGEAFESLVGGVLQDDTVSRHPNAPSLVTGSVLPALVRTPSRFRLHPNEACPARRLKWRSARAPNRRCRVG